MAESNTTVSMDLVSENGTTRISEYRCVIAIESATEIEDLCKTLRSVTKTNNEVFAIRGITARMQELSRIIMSALCDDSEPTENLAFSLRRERNEEIA